MSHSGFPIKIAAKRSGLTPFVIRAWERRYAAVTPDRSGTDRRLYSDAEIERLALLRKATVAGHSISSVASLSPEELRALVEAESAAAAPLATTRADTNLALKLAEAFAAVAALDASALDRVLQDALVKSGRTAVMHQLLVPLIHQMGDAWQNGELRVAHEHVASAVIRTFLGNFVRSHSETVNAPVLLVTTPAGQLHELGALLAAATASDHGWRITYLGPNLPPEEVAGAFRQNKADALAISIVYPADDPALAAQLRILRDMLPDDAPILAGGRAAPAYADELREIGAAICTDIPTLVAALADVRKKRLKR